MGEHGGLVEDLAARLRYEQDDGSWCELPEWASFLLQLGAAVVRHDHGASRLLVAISVPTRAYAASLVATGAVACLAEQPNADDVAAHYTYLRGLALGTTVTYRLSKQRKVTAVLERFGSDEDGDYLVLEEKVGLIRKIPSRYALNIEVSRRQRSGPAKVAQVRVIRSELGLAAGLNGATTDYLVQSRLGCVIIGSEGRIRDDLETPLGIMSTAGGILNGQLQDLARVKRFGKDGEGFRSEIVSDLAADPPDLRDTPQIAVFDGARCFLRSSGRWAKLTWALILDRAEPRYDDARAEIDRLYTTRRAAMPPDMGLPAPPPGVEYTAFGVDGT